MRQPDILAEIYAAAERRVPLSEIRHIYGGQAVYLRGTDPADTDHRRAQRQRIIEDLRRLPVRTVAAAHGVSKSTAGRLRKLG